MRHLCTITRRKIALGVMLTACVAAGPAGGVEYPLVPVGNGGNANDTTGFGAVTNPFWIGKYEVTIGQYAEFLNAVAATDTYTLYNANMGSDARTSGIVRSGSPGGYAYAVTGPSGTTPAGADSPGNRPVTFVSWFDAARFTNWMANGQPIGAQDPTTTETGAYALNGATSGTGPARSAINPNTGTAPTFFIPTENQWYKAAYYSPLLNSGAGGYYDYATQSNANPGNAIGSGTNQANYRPLGFYAVTSSTSTSPGQNYLTNVGAFTASPSYYGTFDQCGNVGEWNDFTGAANSSRGRRGGSFSNTLSPNALSATYRDGHETSYSDQVTGFRLVSAVPEPGLSATAAGVVLACWVVLRRSRLGLARRSLRRVA
ncbi:MAG: formylglycine-generating enzyme family protein [Planctomycetota bacterium]